MICPKCGYDSTRVLESRLIDNGINIRRRRQCENCEVRFTTFERIEIVSLNVIKSNGAIEKYNREKLEESLFLACDKRGVPINTLFELINMLENSWTGKKEISSKEIGVRILEGLKKIDNIAYIRYASIHLSFKDVYDFMKFVQDKFL